MGKADLYKEACEKILGGLNEAVLVEFNNTTSNTLTLYYKEGEKTYHFTLRPRVTHYTVRFNSAEGFKNFLQSNASIFNRRFVEVVYVNKKLIITEAEILGKNQKRRGQ